MNIKRNFLIVLLFIASLSQSFGQTTNDYRTKNTTGGPYNWSTVANWQRYNGTAWVAASVAPNSTSNVITILSGSNYKLDANLTLDQLVIQNSASLTINSSKTLTISNGAGEDLLNNGTLTNSGTLTLGASTVFTNGGIFYNNSTTTLNGTINNGVTLNNSGTLTMNSGSVLANTGTITNSSTITVSGTLNNNNLLTNNATVNMNSVLNNNGTFNNNLNFKINGTVNNSGTINENYLTNLGTSTAVGTLNNNAGANFNILNSGQLYIGFGATKTGTLINNGTITNSATSSTNPGLTLKWGGITNSSNIINTTGSYAILYNGTTITNNLTGIITNNGAFTIDGTLTNNGTYNERYLLQLGYNTNAVMNNNSGAIFNIQSTGVSTGGQLIVGSILKGFSGTVNNSGSINNYSTDLDIPGVFVDNGTVNNTGDFTNNAGSYFYNNNGTVNVVSGYSFLNNGFFTNYNLVNVNGTFNNNGAYNELWGTIVGKLNSGVFNNNSGATYTIDASTGIQLQIGSSSAITGTFNNAGILTNNVINSNGILVNYGTLSNSGVINNNGGNWHLSGSTVVFDYFGFYLNPNGLVQNSGTINSTRSFAVNGGATFNNNATGIFTNTGYANMTGSSLNASFNNFGTYNENFETFLSTTGSGSGLLTNKSGGNIFIATDGLMCFSTSKGTLINDANGTITNLGVFSGYPGLYLGVAGTLLTNNGTILDQGNIYNKGTLTNNALFEYYMTSGSITGTQNLVYGVGSTLSYHGTIAQTTSNFEFPPTGVPTLIINNSNSNGVTLSKPGIVNNKLVLMAGLINSDATNILTIADNATVSTDGINTEAGSATSFVNGPVKKTGTLAFTFPVGDVSSTNALIWAPVGIASHLSSNIVAEYFYANYGNNLGASNMCDPASLDHVSGIEHWLLTSNNAFPAVTLYWKDASRSDITAASDLVVSHWESCSGSNKWANMGGSVVDNSGNGSVTSTVPLTSYSPFTFGTVNRNNPLPVNILSFEASCNNGKVAVKWSTSSETNNDFFSLERSIDARIWNTIATIDGAGNSNQILNYEYTDANSIGGISYYRLKQTDFNGNFEYFSPVSVICSSETSDQMNIYPNPFKGDLVIHYADLDEGIGRVRVADMLGNIVMDRMITVFEGSNDYLVDLHDLSIGIYNIEFSTGSIFYHKKVVKN